MLAVLRSRSIDNERPVELSEAGFELVDGGRVAVFRLVIGRLHQPSREGGSRVLLLRRLEAPSAQPPLRSPDPTTPMQSTGSRSVCCSSGPGRVASIAAARGAGVSSSGRPELPGRGADLWACVGEVSFAEKGWRAVVEERVQAL